MKKYTKEQILIAAEIGEVSMIDARHIVSLLDEAVIFERERKLRKQNALVIKRNKVMTNQITYKDMTFQSGDIWNIGQTVNGVDTFIVVGDKWFYYSERMMREYEYDQEELSKLIYLDKVNGETETLFITNIFNVVAGG